MKKFFSVALLGTLLTTAGCGGLPSVLVSRNAVVPDGISYTPAELAQRIKQIQKDVAIEEAEGVLGFKLYETRGVHRLVKPDDKQSALFGKIVSMGSPAEIKKSKDDLDRHDIFEISTSVLNRRVAFDSPISYETTDEGPAVVAQLVFYDGKYVGSTIDEKYVKEQKRNYIFSWIGGLFYGGASQATKKIP